MALSSGRLGWKRHSSYSRHPYRAEHSQRIATCLSPRTPKSQQGTKNLKFLQVRSSILASCSALPNVNDSPVLHEFGLIVQSLPNFISRLRVQKICKVCYNCLGVLTVSSSLRVGLDFSFCSETCLRAAEGSFLEVQRRMILCNCFALLSFAELEYKKVALSDGSCIAC